MKYFAKLDTTNKVISVYSVHDNEAPTEEAGIIFLSQLHNYSYWKETKKDGSIRKNYAGKGYQYNNAKDAFIPPKINFDSWVLNESTCQWKHQLLILMMEKDMIGMKKQLAGMK